MNKLLMIAFLVTNFSVQAQQEPSAESEELPEQPISKLLSVSFEDELLEGAVEKPDLQVFFKKKDMDLKRMIKLRKSFVPEAIRDKGLPDGTR